jgi:probable HAF family extracellular repeat protein
MHDLGSLAGDSEAWGINDRGQVVGTAQSGYELRQHAFLWENGRMIDLTGNCNANVTIARDINNHSQIVGVEMLSVPDADYPYRAILWQNHKTIDLNTCIPRDSGWYLLNANGINDAGQIVGYGFHEGYWGARAFLLTPRHPLVNYSTEVAT